MFSYESWIPGLKQLGLRIAGSENSLKLWFKSVFEFWRTAGFNKLCASIFFQNAAADTHRLELQE